MSPTIDKPRVHVLSPGSQVANDPSLIPIIKAFGGVGTGCEGPEA